MNVRHEPDECYSQEEILGLIRALASEDITRIQRVASAGMRGWSPCPGYVEVEDLFNEAVIRTAEGKRCWKRGHSAFNHFIAVMRSIRHQGFKQAGRFTPLDGYDVASQERSASVFDAEPVAARLKTQLRQDALALDVLESMMDETRPRCAQESMAISAKAYWAARKRIRRRAKHISGASGLTYSPLSRNKQAVRS